MLRTDLEKIKFNGTFEAPARIFKKENFKVGYKKYNFPKEIFYQGQKYIYDRKTFEGQSFRYYYKQENNYNSFLTIW